MISEIKVGFCIAYDWHLLKHALPLVYNCADTICLSIDKNRVSWSNNPYEWNENDFSSFIKSIDSEKKIVVYEEDFHVPQLSAMENEVRQRNMMAEKMGNGGWHIQLDCDEYCIDFQKFVNYLRRLSISNIGKVNVCCSIITLFKQVEEGFLIILPLSKKDIEFTPIATNFPYYEYGRINGSFNLYTNINIIHQSWARSEKEAISKLNNWGHKNDFNVDHYLALWRSLSHMNYKSYHNFHPVKPSTWSALTYCRGKNVEEFIQNFHKINLVSFPAFDLLFRNSLTWSRIKKLFNMLVK